MTNIKLCGLRRPEDIEAANALRPEYVGFVFASGSRRRVTPEQAEALKRLLNPGILAVGVFVNERPERIAELLSRGTIDLAQLHGDEDAAYLEKLRLMTKAPIIQAFRIRSEADLAAAAKHTADYVLLDAGAGDGKTFDWAMLKEFDRPYFLAGGLTPENVSSAVRALRPFAVDVSSGIETDGAKDPVKMRAFVAAVRK